MFRWALCSLRLRFRSGSAAGENPPDWTSAGSGDANNLGIEAFRQRLRDLGYIEGENVLVEYRYAGGRRTVIPSLVAELVQLKVDVLVVGSPRCGSEPSGRPKRFLSLWW